MAGDDDGHAAALREGADKLAHLLYAGGVEPVRRLVENEELGEAQQCRRETEALLHAEGECRGALALLPVEPDDLQHLVNVLLRQGEYLGVHAQVFPRGEVSVIRRGLDERADAAQKRHTAFLREALSEKLYLPRRGVHEPEQHFQRCGLARAVRADKAVYAPLAHAHVQFLHRGKILIPLCERGGLDYLIHHSSSFPRRVSRRRGRE